MPKKFPHCKAPSILDGTAEPSFVTCNPSARRVARASLTAAVTVIALADPGVSALFAGCWDLVDSIFWRSGEYPAKDRP